MNVFEIGIMVASTAVVCLFSALAIRCMMKATSLAFRRDVFGYNDIAVIGYLAVYFIFLASWITRSEALLPIFLVTIWVTAIADFVGTYSLLRSIRRVIKR